MVRDSDGRRDAYMNKATEEDLQIVQRILEIAGVPKWEYSINVSQENTLCFFLIGGEIHVFVPERNENKGVKAFSDWKSAIDYAIPFWDGEYAARIEKVVKTLESELSKAIKDEEPITEATDTATETVAALTASDAITKKPTLIERIKKKAKDRSHSQSELIRFRVELEKAIMELKKGIGADNYRHELINRLETLKHGTNDTLIQRWLQRAYQSVQKLIYDGKTQMRPALTSKRKRQIRKHLSRRKFKQKKQGD